MAFKVVNNTVINNDTDGDLNLLKIQNVCVLEGDGNGTITLKNVVIDGGSLSLNSDSIAEGTNNLYFTDARAQAALAGDIVNLQTDIATGDTTTLAAAQAYADSVVSTGTGSLTTDNISEGSNLYYTDARVANYLTVNNYATEAYADQSETDAISASNAYTDGEILNTITALEAYSDQSELDAITTANAYTDTREVAITAAYTTAIANSSASGSTASNAYTDAQIVIATTNLEAYADQAEADAITTAAADATAKTNAAIITANNNAFTYTDAEILTATTNLEAYADQAEADALTASKAYTDLKEIQITTAYESYADQAEADAITSSNAYTDTAVAGVVDSAPAVLDTLNELAAALGDDANFATTVSNDIGTKVSKAGDTMLGDLTLAGAPSSANHAATKSYVDSQISSGALADTDSLPEGSINLYYTDARADARATLRIGAADIGNLNNVSGGSLSTGDFLLYDGSEFLPVTFVTEVNTYADQRIAVSSIQDLSDIDGVDTPTNGDILLYDNNSNHFGFINLGNEINSYFDIRFATKNTNNLSEGSNNLYYTDARVDARIPTNISSFTNDSGYVTTDTNTTYTAGNGISLSSTTFSVAAGNGLTQEASGLKMSGSYTGDFTASGDVCAYSDKRLKRNIKTIDNAIETVQNLRGVTFEKSLQPSLGVIAQEVEDVLPELVKTDSDGMKSVAYGNMVGVLIEAIKEQQRQIDELKQKLENM